MSLDDRGRMSVACHWIPAFPASVRPIGGLTGKSRLAAAWMYAGLALETDKPPAAAELRTIFERFRTRRFTQYTGGFFDF